MQAHAGQIGITPGRPRRQYVGFRQHFVQPRIPHRIIGLLAPPGGNPEHDGVAAINGIVLQEFDQLPGLGQRVGAAIVEADSPDRHERLVTVILIRRAVADSQVVHEMPPVAHDALDFPRGQPG